MLIFMTLITIIGLIDRLFKTIKLQIGDIGSQKFL